MTQFRNFVEHTPVNSNNMTNKGVIKITLQTNGVAN